MVIFHCCLVDPPWFKNVTFFYRRIEYEKSYVCFQFSCMKKLLFHSLVQFPTPLLLPCLQIKAIWFHHSCVISYTHAWVSLLQCQKYKQQYTGWSCCIYSLCGSWFLKLTGFDNDLSWASLDKWSSWSNDTGKFLNLNPFVLLCLALNSQLITRNTLTIVNLHCYLLAAV